MWHPPPKRGTPSLHRGNLREHVAAARTTWQLHCYGPCHSCILMETATQYFFTDALQPDAAAEIAKGCR